MKGRRSFYNILLGLISLLITIFFNLIIPRLFILKLGSEVNGFMSSITQIFIYLMLLEAGVGEATIQALYKPLTVDDKESLNGILSATSRYYNKTGKFYLLTVVIISILYPIITKSQINSVTISLVILFTGVVGVINYFLQAKFKLLLIAEGKTYIITTANLVVNTLSNITKIVLLLLNFNILIIQISYFIISFLQMFLIWIYIKKHYKWIDLKVKPDYSAISQKNSVLVHQISGMVFYNTDVLILTFFCGFAVVSVYTMYNLIFQMISSVITNISSGVIFVLGSSYFEDKEKFLDLYNSFESYYMSIVFALSTISYILILPFMKLYTAGITDVNYIDTLLPTMFAILNLLSYVRMPGVYSINIAGHFKKTQYRSIFESVINIIVSLICVNFFGIYGVLIGSITALLYRTNDIILYTSKQIIKRNSLITYKKCFINIAILFIIVFLVYKFNLSIESYSEFLIIGSLLLITVIP